MKTKVVAIAILGLGAFVAPASAQIIATSIPRADSGGKAAEKKFAFHVLAAPLAKWKYGEVFIGDIGPDLAVGTVQAKPNSDFLLAGEVAFKAGRHWTVGVGGWYNKVGNTTYGFDGDVLFSDGFGQMTVDLGGDLTIYEGHANLFFKDIGIQAGVVRTSGTIGDNAKYKTFTFDGQPFKCTDLLSASDCNNNAIDVFKGNTTDWDVFAVYKHAWGGKSPLSISLGAGGYRKQGSSDTPLRSTDSTTVFTAFATASVSVYKGLGLDASFWYIDKTDATKGEGSLASKSAGTDSQSRFTIGLGYTFSK